MKQVSSLNKIKKRHPKCQIVRRKRRIYCICKAMPKYKAVQK